MTIRMPTFTDLSSEQRKILRDLPIKGTSLVVGPPGTGKTVIAMFRALQISKIPGNAVTLITHSKVLAEHSKTWSEKGFDAITTSTYHSFIHRIWKQHGGEGYAPVKHGAESKYEKDWAAISEQLSKNSSQPRLGHLVVDEGQDLPPEFYKFMAIYNMKGWVQSCSVFADENQRLDPIMNSTIAQIRESLGQIALPIELPLTINFRNTLQIAKAAASFFVGAASDRPKFPEGRPGGPVEMRQCVDLTSMADRISTLAINDQSRSLLIICGSQSIAKKLRNRIEARLIQYGPRQVTWYKRNDKQWGDAAKLRPGENGVVAVVHTSSMKGLEADAVFVAGLEGFEKGHDGADVENMNLYVTTSRARSTLEILYEDPRARLVPDVASKVRETLSLKSKAELKSLGF